MKNLNKNCEKVGFSFVFEYVEIKNFKIFKKKNNGTFTNSLFDTLIYSSFDKKTFSKDIEIRNTLLYLILFLAVMKYFTIEPSKKGFDVTFKR